MSNDPLRIRGHHLLCMFGFRGFGYSPEFIRNMQSTTDRFLAGDALRVELSCECDDICGACPHRRDEKCFRNPDAPERVRARDEGVLEALDLAEGEWHESTELHRRIAEKVAPADLDRLCAGCSWLEAGWCKEGLAALREAAADA